MNIYHYHPREGLSQSLADPDPMNEGQFLIPAHATVIVPPIVETGHAVIFKEGEWQEVEDHRGTLLYDKNGVEKTLATLGPIPEGWSLEPPPPVLEERQTQALAQVDGEAEATRALFITQGDGQAMVYQEKVAEAERVMALAADATLDPTLYPLLAAEAAALGGEVKVLATTILTLRTQWLQVAAQIEATRIKAKEEIKAAANPEQIQTILDGLSWPAAS